MVFSEWSFISHTVLSIFYLSSTPLLLRLKTFLITLLINTLYLFF
ncbi:hypothetical protein AtEden1_Chr2g0259461 [Arabidopsis thaliana]